jgi:hypothetical protein
VIGNAGPRRRAVLVGVPFVGALTGGCGDGAEARQACYAHTARRDSLSRTVQDLGGTPAAAAPAYALPLPVPDAAAAVRPAAELENRVAGVYAGMVRATTAGLRRETGSLREVASRAVRWSGRSVAFPGLAERAGTAGPSPSASPGAL